MKIVNLSERDSALNRFLAELRDTEYQRNKTLFRNNIGRVGAVMAYEISKRLNYEKRTVKTPLDTAEMRLPTDKLVVATVLRAGLPFHEGFLQVFDDAESAFVSAYRTYSDANNSGVNIHSEYIATPNLSGKVLLLVDPMLATGGSMAAAYHALLMHGKPRAVHFACVIAAPEGIDALTLAAGSDNATLWMAALDGGLNSNKYIVPGFGDAGDLCFGEKE